MNDSVVDDEWDEDVLKRKKYSVFLTRYLESKTDACVININAPWGSGKTFFVKKWLGDLKKNHPAVYFNAWENDYSNDPLISILSCINKEIIPLLPESTAKKHTTRNFLESSGKMIKKLAPIIIKGALSKAIGEGGVDALAEITNDEEASITELSSCFTEELLKSNETISSSIDEFKGAVTLLIKEVAKNKTLKSPLFIIIDELDRCRPLYSIELLERIKHIFGIPEVVFIVSNDTQQLSHSVKAIYGESFNGEVYLRRFFDQIYTLPEPDCIEYATLLFKDFVPKAKYFEYYIDAKGGSLNKYYSNSNKEENINTLTCKQNGYEMFVLVFSLFSKFFKLDLRSQKQCFDRFTAIERSLSDKEELHFGYLIFLIMLDAKSSTQFQKYFACYTQKEREEILANFENALDNLRIYNNQYTAKNLIERYSQKTLLTNSGLKRMLDESSQSSELDDFDHRLTFSCYQNFKYLAKYRERVEMAEALG